MLLPGSALSAHKVNRKQVMVHLMQEAEILTLFAVRAATKCALGMQPQAVAGDSSTVSILLSFENNIKIISTANLIPSNQQFFLSQMREWILSSCMRQIQFWLILNHIELLYGHWRSTMNVFPHRRLSRFVCELWLVSCYPRQISKSRYASARRKKKKKLHSLIDRQTDADINLTLFLPLKERTELLYEYSSRDNSKIIRGATKLRFLSHMLFRANPNQFELHRVDVVRK